MHKYLLEELGQNTKVLAFEPPLCNLAEFWKKLHWLRKNWWLIGKTIPSGNKNRLGKN